MVGGGGNDKVVATLRADGSVFPASGTSMNQLANLMNYKIRTDIDIGSKSLSTMSIPTTVVDLGKQLLQYARDGDLRGVKNMLSRGAPFTTDWLGMSALHFAAMNNQYEICDTLIKGGHNRDAKTKVDRTPLHMACFYGNVEIVELLLSKMCAVNPRDMLRMTPLHWAVEKGHKSIVRLLLKYNADVTVVSKFGRTPTALAVLTEQADILQELEAAKHAQLSRKMNEENVKETSEAVNSIMEPTDFENKEFRLQKIKTEIDLPESQYEISDNIKESGTSTVHNTHTINTNVLQKHGISVGPDKEETSNGLLCTALRDGRQLVLSEGGRLLLHEAQNNNHTNTDNTTSVVPNKLIRMLPPQEPFTSRPAVNKTRPNVIAKAKDNPNMYKNVKIISLNDFKKFYGPSNVRTVQKIPPSITKGRVVKQIGGDVKPQNTAPREVYMNPRHLPQRQMKSIQSSVNTGQTNKNNEDKDVETKMESEARMSSTSQQLKLKQLPQVVKKPPVVIATAKNRVERVNSFPVLQVPALQQISPSPNIIFPDFVTKPPTQPVSLLLSLPEICRQLCELRRHNDELQRKLDVVQKEKEEMVQRLDRLEELLLVETTDDICIET